MKEKVNYDVAILSAMLQPFSIQISVPTQKDWCTFFMFFFYGLK